MKTDSLNLNNLRNDAHFQFYTEFCSLVERFGAEELKIKVQYDIFLVLFNDLDKALKKISKSAITAEIRKADKYRDKIWSGMVDANKSATKHYNNEMCRAAERLKIVFDTYGNIALKPLDEETGAIHNILQDLESKYEKDVATVGLTGWIKELRNANEKFKSLMMNRYDESASKTTLVIKEVRMKIDEVYRAITERINAAVIIEGEAQYHEFLSMLNAVIKRFADILAQRQGRKKVVKTTTS